MTPELEAAIENAIENTMLERVALVIGDGLGGTPGIGAMYRDCEDIRWSQAMTMAQAVLDAMSEPTCAMIERGCAARNLVAGTAWTDGLTEGVQSIERMLSERSYKAMIGAARENQPHQG